MVIELKKCDYRVEISLKKPVHQEVVVFNTRKIAEIQLVLTEILYVPNEKLKLVVVLELLDYLKDKFSKPNYKIEFVYTKEGNVITGFVVCQIDTDYRSYGMKCPSFGWLHAKDFRSCELLMNECEDFVRRNKFRKIRGPINFPKKIGGIGFQTEGFEAPMLSGVAFNEPSSRILEYLEELGYKKDSKYSCVEVIQTNWKKGYALDKNLIMRFLPLNEIRKLRSEILSLAQHSFHSVLADALGGHSRFEEFMDSYKHLYGEGAEIKKELDQSSYSSIPEFIEMWESIDFNSIVPCCDMAFDRTTGELVGIIMAFPNLFQLWSREPLTQLNIDTVIIKKEYAGRGIFSSLGNVGQLTCKLYGLDYLEGTTIWANNDRAVKTIFPHCKPVRTHYVVQKRILRK
ncbi:MAG: hypothetical protein EAX91_01905 [Candidatus Lokiarchaeota archaeon]|nr:hypothetical protein [Candidatus Lokiarchaeota archaeon]